MQILYFKSSALGIDCYVAVSSSAWAVTMKEDRNYEC